MIARDRIGGARLFACIAAALVVLATCGPVLAKTRRLVLLCEDPDAPETERLVLAVGAQLSDLDVELVSVGLGGTPVTVEGYAEVARSLVLPENTVAVLWTWRDRSGGWHLYVTRAAGQRFLVRVLEPGEESDRLEALGLIVRSSTAALLAGGEIGVGAPDQPEGALPSGGTEDETERGIEGVAAAGYRLLVRSGEASTHGFRVALSISPVAPLAFRMGYVFFSAIEAREAQASIDIRRHPIDLGVLAGHSWRRLSLWAGAEIIASVDVQRTARIDTAGAFERSNTDLIWSAAIGAEIRFDLSSRVALYLEIAVELPIDPVRYVFDGADGPTAIEQGWRAQPRTGAGAIVRFL